MTILYNITIYYSYVIYCWQHFLSNACYSWSQLGRSLQLHPFPQSSMLLKKADSALAMFLSNETPPPVRGVLLPTTLRSGAGGRPQPNIGQQSDQLRTCELSSVTSSARRRSQSFPCLRCARRRQAGIRSSSVWEQFIRWHSSAWELLIRWHHIVEISSVVSFHD